MKPRARRGWVFALVAAGVGVGLWWSLRPGPSLETIFEPEIAPVEAAAFCPWRQPEADLARYFPGATGSTMEPAILSGQLTELAEALGRPLTPEENPLRRHRVRKQDELLGFVLTHRLRGEHGAIEVVLALDQAGRVEGVNLQRMREPKAIAAALTDPAWLAAFQGRTVTHGWQLGLDLPEVIPAARKSAAAIAEGVRCLLVLNAGADKAIPLDDHTHHSR